MIIAIPTDAPGGLDAAISDHFGHCHAFTLVELQDGKPGEATILTNEGHGPGGCAGPVKLLKERGVEAVVAGGMGMGPLAGLRKNGITVYFRGDAQTAREAAEQVIAGKCRELKDEHMCQGHGDGHDGGGCGQHQQQELVKVEGPVEDGRLVHLRFDISVEGEHVDSSEARYLHGRNQLPPGLERAMEGHVAGDTFDVKLTPDVGYGERDEERVMEVPLERLPEGIKVGESVQAHLPDGSVATMNVLELKEKTAMVDGNHPLAGKSVLFKVELLGIYTEAGEKK